MPSPLIVGNWKMHKTVAEAAELARAVRKALEGVLGVEVVLCPPFTALCAVKEALEGSGIGVGAQNMHPSEKGAFTGEVSPLMLQELCEYVILGHSERRHIFGETDEFISRKVKATLTAGLRPIICVGETLEQRRAGRADEVVGAQLRSALAGVASAEELVVAYEPVWAIGTGVPATPEAAQGVMGGIIQATLVGLFGEETAFQVPLLYGGSVTASNIEGFAAQPAIHGALVGGASLKAEEFAQIVRTAAKVAEG
ncbi:MAG: triose-phosphate isomerase [Chloroflexi bacterium]|nr:triose-phosphate isomerase [Chloroflexota bacterium]